MKLLVFLLIFTLHAQESFKDYQVQSPKLEAPKRGSLKGDFAELGDKSLSLKTGSYSISLPVKFPNKSGEMLYPLNVSYSPAYGVSEFGIGWDMGLKINRMREVGIIDYTESDLLTGPWGIMKIGDDGYWYTRDLRKKVRALIDDDGLTVFLSDGKVLTFTEIEANDQNQVYSWYLTVAQDKVGRKTRYSYQRFESEGRPYLVSVDYGGIGEDYQYQIALSYLLTKTPYFDYSSGKKRVANYRVDQIAINTAEGGNLWRYDFSFDENFLSPSYYLRSLKKVYSTGAEEPEVLFNYDLPGSFLETINWEIEPKLDELTQTYNSKVTSHSYIALNDFNNDGLIDIEIDQLYDRYIATEGGFIHEPLVEGSGDVSSWCLFPVVHSRTPRKYLQFNGPATESMVYDLFEYQGKTVLDVCHADGVRIDHAIFPKHWFKSDQTIFHDINRDGFPDLVHLNGNTISYALNRGEINFDDPTVPQYINLPHNFKGFWIRDINGDGQGDLVLKGVSTLYVHYGYSDGSFAVDNETYDFYRANGSLNSRPLSGLSLQFVDVNKDSLPDILMQGHGFVSLHINDGHRYVEYYVPGLFVDSSLYQNMVIGDLAGDGANQILSTVRVGEEYRVMALKLDRPSLGLLQELDDGKGNRLQFSYAKSTPQQGVSNRKTVVSSLKKITTGEGEIEYLYNFGDIATHSLTKNFLGYIESKSAVAGLGERKSIYGYTENNLDMVLENSSYSFANPTLIKTEQKNYVERNYQGIDYVDVVQSFSGYTDGSQLVGTTSNMEYEGVCISSIIKTADGKSLTTNKSFSNIASFDDHLSCLESEVALSGNDFSYLLTINRDLAGRPVQIYRGGTLLQQISYGSNGNISAMVEAGKGVTQLSYDSYYRLDGIMAPDDIIIGVDSFDPISEEPMNIDLSRWTWNYDQEFRFDGYGRLQKNWNNLGGFNENNPLLSYEYLFATNSNPGKVFESKGVEVVAGSFLEATNILLQTGNDRELAVAQEVSGGYRIKNLTEYRLSEGVISKRMDYLAENSDILDFGLAEISFEQKDYVGLFVMQESAVQDGVYRQVGLSNTLSNGLLVNNSIENGDSSLKITTFKDGWGKTVEYKDQAGHSYSYEFDSLGRIKAISLPDGNIQTITYDSVLGKIERIDRSEIGHVEYSYDQTTTLLIEKRIFSKENKLVRDERYLYDSIGRMTRKDNTSYKADGSVDRTYYYNFFYDGLNLESLKRVGQLGHMTGTSTSDYETKMVYRPDGKVLEETLDIYGFKKIEVFYEYLSHSEIKSKQYVVSQNGTVSSDNKISYFYNRFGNVEKVQLNGFDFADFAYNDWEDIASISIVGNKSIVLGYDSLTRESRDYEEKNGLNTIMKQQWSYSNRGHISNSTFSLGSRTVSNGYSYERRGFLESMNRSDSDGTDLNLAYGYSNSGLMDIFTKDGNDTSIIMSDSQWQVGDTVYALDSLGRVVSNGDKNYQYGATGRILSVSQNDTILASYIYDDDNNPIIKTYANGSKEVYFEDGVLKDEFVLPLKVGTRVIGYLRDNNFQAASVDHLNSYAVDENGVANLNTPYGDREARSEASKIIDFTLKGYDDEIEAVRMGHRYFSPKAKRFLTADSYLMENVEELVKRPAEMNLYGYARNNPLNNIDPLGNASLGVQLGGSVTIGPIRVELPSVTLKVARNDSEKSASKGSYSFSFQGSLGGVKSLGDKTQGGYTTGVAGVHGAVGATLKLSNADHVSQLSGTALSHGASAGTGVDLSASLTTSITKVDGSAQENYSGTPVTEMSFGLSGGLGVEGYTSLESNNTPQLSSSEIDSP